MAVQEQTPYIEYTGNGVATSFALGFNCESKDHLIVLVDNVEPNVGTWSLANGSVVFGTAPADGKIISIQRNTPFRRDTNFQSYDNSLRPATINKDLDWIWYKLQELGVADWILSNRIDALKNYVDDRDDELRAYLMEEIRKQGVALDQLDEYYNYLMQRLAQIAVDKGWDASFIVDKSGKNLQQVNDGLPSIADLISTPTPIAGSKLNVNSHQGGVFLYDPNLVSTNNHGTVFNGWIRQFVDWVKPEWFGAIADGTTDCTLAIQRAINFCILEKTLSPGTLGSGAYGIEFGKGIYKVDGTLNLTSAIGLRMKGVSTHATVILTNESSKDLFKWTVYLDVAISDMSIYSGTLTEESGLLKFTVTPEGSRTNVCHNFNSTNTGSFFVEDRLFYAGFKTVYSSKNSTVNGDNHTHNQCVYLYNDLKWDNTNPNAVIWAFNECKSYHNIDCFKNAGSTLTVRGGDWINKGTFLIGNTNGFSTDCNFYDMRFEMYQNIDPTTNPKFLDLSASHTLTFTGCSSRGGGDISGKVTASLNGIYDIEFKRCNIRGIFNCNVGTSTAGLTSRLAFNKCDAIPTINQTLNSNQGSRPLNIDLIGHRVSSSGSVNRTYCGGLSNSTAPMADSTFADRAYFEAVINATTQARSLPVFNLAPYVLKVVGFDISFWSNGVQPVTIDIYSDSTKSKKLATVTTEVKQNQYQVFEIRSADLLASHDITTSGISNLFAEISSANNAGLCRLNISTKLRQVN